jgi:DNA-directed RNA polymerase subunit M/transcription elongation factor TFIIS
MSAIFAHSDPKVFRIEIANEFERLFSDGNSEGDLKIQFIGENIEKGIFNYTIKEAGSRQIIKKWYNTLFCEIYAARLKTVLINLKQNKVLLNQLKTGEITPIAFAMMTHQEMNPEQWKPIIDRKIKRDRLKFTNNVEASTDMYTCGRCKSKKCTYYEMQTRSADEPTTVFVTCLNCGKNWKN